jgi:integrase/recombinase XerD
MIVMEKIKDVSINSYLDYLKYERKLSDNTYKSYAYNLSSFYAFFPNGTSIKDLSDKDIKDFLYKLKLTNKSKAHYLTVLKSFYAFLIREGSITKNPIDGIKMPKIEKKLPNYLTIEEVDELLNIKLEKPNDYRNKTMLELLYASGMRISELTNLKASQVDFNESLVRIMGKGKKERIVPLNDVSLHYIEEYLNIYRPLLLRSKESEYVFVNNHGTKMSRQGFFKILKKICEDKGIKKDVSPHTLRHSFATHLLNNGADLRIIQELLGHENLVTTEIYSHLQNKKIKDDYDNHPRAKID